MRFNQYPSRTLHGKTINLLCDAPSTALVDNGHTWGKLSGQTNDLGLASVKFHH